jgi:hypothetical protein
MIDRQEARSDVARIDPAAAGALIGARNVRKLGQPTGPHARTYGHGTTPAATFYGKDIT